LSIWAFNRILLTQIIHSPLTTELNGTPEINKQGIAISPTGS